MRGMKRTLVRDSSHKVVVGGRRTSRTFVGIAMAAAVTVLAAATAIPAYAANPSTSVNKNPTYNFSIPAQGQEIIAQNNKLVGFAYIAGNVTMTDGVTTVKNPVRTNTTHFCIVSANITTSFTTFSSLDSLVVDAAATFYESVLKRETGALSLRNVTVRENESISGSVNFPVITHTVSAQYVQNVTSDCRTLKSGVGSHYTPTGTPTQANQLWSTTVLGAIQFIAYPIITLAAGLALVNLWPMAFNSADGTTYANMGVQAAVAGFGSMTAFVLAQGTVHGAWTATLGAGAFVFLFAGISNPLFATGWAALKNKATLASAALRASYGSQTEGRRLTEGGGPNGAEPHGPGVNPLVAIGAYPAGGLSTLSSALSAGMLGGNRDKVSVNQAAIYTLEEGPSILQTVANGYCNTLATAHQRSACFGNL